MLCAMRSRASPITGMRPRCRRRRRPNAFSARSARSHADERRIASLYTTAQSILVSEHGPCTIAWLPPLAAAVAAGETAVLVVVATVQGSAPRETGAAMVVTANACTGSVGGGHLEFEALRVARDALDQEATGTWTVRFPLAARLGQCCGGIATLAFTRVDRNARAWLDAAVACERTAAPFALLACIAAAPGSQLVVTADDARGTLGSADLDSAAVALARTRLAGAAQGSALVPFDAG